MKSVNLQDVFLNTARREKIPIILYLVSGYQLRGTVKGFDQFTILLDCGGVQNMVYKHAVSTMSPSRYISFMEAEKGEASNESSRERSDL